MSAKTFTITGTLDEELYAEHVAANERQEGGAETYPLAADPDEWTWDDLKAAIEEEFLIDVEVVR